MMCKWAINNENNVNEQSKKYEVEVKQMLQGNGSGYKLW